MSTASKISGAVVKEKGSKLLGGIGIGGAINGAFAISDYKSKRKEGSGMIGSAAYAGGNLVLNSMLGLGPMLALQLAPALPAMGINAVEGLGKMQRQMSRVSKNTPFQNATFNDHAQAFTMRQAGMQLAEASRYNLQQSLMGNEASMLRY